MGRSFLVVMSMLLLSSVSVEDALERAHSLYQEGETATDEVEAMHAFNEALELYRQAAFHYPCSSLYANVANCYYQLSEYPWAILFYERALSLTPRDRHIRSQRAQAIEAAGLLQHVQAEPWLAQLLGCQWLSIAERVWLALGAGVLLALFGSLAIWLRGRLYMRLAVSTAVASLLLLGSVLALGVCVPQAAVLTKGAVMRVDAGLHYAVLDHEPVLAGTKVVVKQMVRDGTWAEVVMRDGSRGYIPAENLGFR